MEKVLLDTSFLISSVKYKIDFISELERIFGICEIIVPKQVFEELNKISLSKKQKIAHRQAALLVGEILKKLKIKKIDLKTRNVDKGILQVAVKNNYVVATIDKDLKKKLKNKNIRILVIKQKSRVAID